MRVVVAGGTGFVGTPLVRRLVLRGDDVAVLSRHPERVRSGRGVGWDGKTAGSWTAEVEAADAVINLAGANVGEGRWTERRKRELVDSRLDATNVIVDALLNATPRERVLIHSSATGYYGPDRDAPADENAPKGQGFLADLTAAWEQAALRAHSAARVVVLRIGVVLASDGGALKKLMLPYRFGAGGRVGNGRQWLSWIDRDDVLSAIEWALARDTVRGIYNITSPNPVTNHEFASTLGRVMRRPAVIPVPAFALRLAFGKGLADEVLLGGQRVLPKRAQEQGFRFSHATLPEALSHVIER